MRKISNLAAICRAAEGVAATSTTAHHHHRILQSSTALYSTINNNTSSSNKSHWFSCNNLARQSAAHAVAGTMLFSVAASTAEVYAKEPLLSKFQPKDVVLYQYEACPFCNKVKAFLDYYDVPYKIVEVNPISKKEIKWSDYKKVPILVVDGDRMVDSADIIDKLHKKFHPEVSAESVSTDDEETQWLGWVDNHLVHVLSPNIYRSASEALESFDYITTHGNFSFTERIVAKYAGATAMYFVSKRLKKRHNITDERAALYDAAETWVNALKGREFLGGSKPNLADISVFGVLRPIRHLKSGKDMVENTHIGDWYSRMENAVGASSKVQAQAA